MYTERRRNVTITTFTSVLYFFLLAMLHTSTALPSSYIKFLNDNQLSSSDLSPQFLNDALSSNSGSTSNEDASQELILLRSGRPISLKEFAETLSAANSAGIAEKPSAAGVRSSPLLVKRQNSGEETAMLRLARNMPQHGVGEKMYQISNIGDLPMFRFG